MEERLQDAHFSFTTTLASQDCFSLQCQEYYWVKADGARPKGRSGSVEARATPERERSASLAAVADVDDVAITTQTNRSSSLLLHPVLAERAEARQ